MPRLIAGIVVGAVLGVLGTLGVQRVLQNRENAAAQHTVDLFQAVDVVMERALPGVRVLDVAFQSPATVDTRYVPGDYDVLYDAHITYQLNGQVKKVILPFGRGKDKDTLIYPSTSEVVLADGAARSHEQQEAGMQPNNELQRTRPAQAMEPRR